LAAIRQEVESLGELRGLRPPEKSGWSD
jgi:hypothetical protein